MGKKLSPPVTVSPTSVAGWLKGPAVPGAGEKTLYFLALVNDLQMRAKEAGSDYARRSPQYWETLLVRARDERNANRGGRPSKGPADHVPVPAPTTLPPAPTGFTGRTDEIEQVLRWLQPPDGSSESGEEAAAVVVSAVSGMGGVGKTALALHVAHQAQARGWFPGGALFADLRGYGDEPVGAAETADRLLRALGVKARDLPPTPDGKTDAWRKQLAVLAAQGLPLLVVLDNVRDPAPAGVLLPGTPHRALLTSRHRLSAMPVRRIELKPLSAADAVALLDRALRAGDTQDDRVTAQPEAALEIVQLCGFLPLALRIIGALLRDEPGRPLAAQARELADERMRLDVLEYEGEEADGRPLAVRASFELSYRHLAQDARRAFRLLGATPGADVSTASAAKLFDRGLAQARRLLAGLARAHLIVSTSEGGADQDPADGERWSMHDLVRLFADERGREHARKDRRIPAVTRLLDHYLTTAAEADGHALAHNGTPRYSRFAGHQQAVAWLEAERANLVSAATAQAGRRHDIGTALTFAVCGLLQERRHLEDWSTLSRSSAAISRERGDLRAEGGALGNLGAALSEMGQLDEAIDVTKRTVEIYHQLGDLASEGMARLNLAGALGEAGRCSEAVEAGQAALEIHRTLKDRHMEARALSNLGIALAGLGRFDEAINADKEAAAIHRRDGYLRGEGMALTNLGYVLVQTGRFEEALEAHAQAIAIHHRTGDRHMQGKSRNALGCALVASGRPQDAVDAHTEAETIFLETGEPSLQAMALHDLGVALQATGRAQEAADAHAQELAIHCGTGDRRMEGVARNALGRALVASGRPQDAVDAHTEAETIFLETGEPSLQAMALDDLGVALQATGRAQEAADAHAQSAALHRETGDRRGEARTLCNQGFVLQEAGKLAEAADAYERAAALFQDVGDIEGQVLALEGKRSAEQSSLLPLQRPQGGWLRTLFNRGNQ
ncbi:tetratricopeptide repeat protein [Streptomyces antibioticus]|uniref:tetratricopeptide repeat protein n=1 Tax=Streptomyces antibioticus TaxID=1890 RepID=UPI003D73CF09